MKTLRSSIGIMMTAAVVSLLCGCEEMRDLYYERETPLKVIVEMDWYYLGEKPEGATIYFYREDGDGYYTFLTNEVNRAEVKVPSGIYTVLVFNLTPEEYGSMSFEGMNSAETARATLLSKNFSWPVSGDTVGRTVYEPEKIVSGMEAHFEVHDIDTRCRPLSKGDTAVTERIDTVRLVTQRMVYDATVNVRVTGIHNLKSMRSYMTGLAGGSYLVTRSGTDTLATFVPQKWTVTRDASDYTKGYLTGTFRCFGLPERYKGSQQAKNNRLVLEMLLVDNKTVITSGFDVGDLIEEDTYEFSLSLLTGTVVLPDVKPEKGKETGFDVKMDDWGEKKDVYL